MNFFSDKLLGHCGDVNSDYDLISMPECCLVPSVNDKFEDCCRLLSEGNEQE